MQSKSARVLFLACAGVLCLPFTALAGGGGQNMLLIVNPNDESSLRIANTYAQLRNIPDRNIVYLAPPVTDSYKTSNNPQTVLSLYGASLTTALQQRGIDSQIDYIGTLGQGMMNVSGTMKDSAGVSQGIHGALSYFLSNRTQWERGFDMPNDDVTYNYRVSPLVQSAPSYDPNTRGYTNFLYTPGTNSAIHHSTQNPIGGGYYTAGYSTEQWYMAGAVGYTGVRGMTTTQVINNLKTTVAGDGQKPAGTIYFEAANDVRSHTREAYWVGVQNYMTAHSIPWVQENNTDKTGYTPQNKTNVRGAVIGGAYPTFPNGSAYVPGSYTDTMTSFAGSYGYPVGQATADRYYVGIGGSASCGTVLEPYAIQEKFTYSSIYVFQNDGSTIGEAWYKSVTSPVETELQGDLLSQPYADLPTVRMTNAPADNATVNGQLSLNASASVPANSYFATKVAKLQLYVDGLDKGIVTPAADGSGSFNLDTTALTDGRHEIRVVAYNDTAAESQGATISHIMVNNKGQGVSATGDSINATWNQQLTIPVSAVKGSGSTISKIDLRSLGRTVGTLTGSTGNLALDVTKLAYGDNSLIPVAVLSDGTEVQGLPLTVNRDFNRMAGKTPLPVGERNPGFRFEYFTGKAGNTMTQTQANLTGATADYDFHANTGVINPKATTGEVNYPSSYLGDAAANAGIVARISGKFNVTTEGEWSFSYDCTNARWESIQLLIDGLVLTTHDTWKSGTSFGYAFAGGSGDTTATDYLLPGEHDLSVLLGNPHGDLDTQQKFTLYYRDPSGETYKADSTMFYTVVPEPSGAVALLPAVFMAMRRRRSVI